MKRINKYIATDEIKKKGYFIVKNFLNKAEVQLIKQKLLGVLHYIHPKKINDLERKYYQVKKFSKKLKSNFYDIIRYDLDILNILHNKEIINLTKHFFKVKNVFSANPQVTIHDDQNERLLLPHQEIANFSRDFIIMSIPIFDTNKINGGLRVFEGSHKKGYFNHKQSQKIKSAYLETKLTNKFKLKDLEVKSGTAIIWHSALIHGSYPTNKKKTVRINIVERFNPLKFLPYLRKANNNIRLPFYNYDYNKIKE